MPENDPPVTPPTTPPAGDTANITTEAQFRAWFTKMVAEHEADTSNVRTGQSDQQSGQSLAQQVEAILTARERRNNNTKRMDDLEKSNADLRKVVEDLTSGKISVKRARSSIFSIFDGL